MKSFVTGLLKGRIARWSLLVAVIVAAGLSVAWDPTPCYRFGGSFIGTGGGTTWNATQVPLDPDGRTAAGIVSVIDYSPDFAGLLAAFGADSTTAHWGQEEMINRDTAKFKLVSYGTKQGNPPQICMIYVLTGTLKWTGRDSFNINYTADVYPGPANILGLPNADANGDGFPDSNATPFLSFPGGGSAKRVSVP